MRERKKSERGDGLKKKLGRRGGALEIRRRIKPRGLAGCSLTAANTRVEEQLQLELPCTQESIIHIS